MSSAQAEVPRTHTENVDMILELLDSLAYPIDFFDERDLCFDKDKCSHRVDGFEAVNNVRCFLFRPTNDVCSRAIGIFGKLL